MFLNAALKQYAVENLEVASEASDDDFKAAISKALEDGTLSGSKYAELVATKETEPVSIATKLADDIGSKFDAAMERMAKMLADNKETQHVERKPETSKEETTSVDADAVMKQFTDKLDAMEKKITDSVKPSQGLTPWDVLKDAAVADEDSEVSIRVKDATERYSHNPTAATRKKGINRGEVITHNGRELDVPTERRKALGGAWFKFQVCPELMTPHEEQIVQYALHNERFYLDNEKSPRLLTETERQQSWNYNRNPTKATVLLDGSTSGGENAVPEFFDTDFIILPVLGGELAPFVNMVDVPRGSSADTFTMGNPTFASATEGSAITLFTTDSFIANHDTTFFRAHGAIKIGLNFLQDSVPRLAEEIMSRYSAKAAEWLDEQIAAGDGSTEPQGVIVDNGTGDITPANPTTGDLTLADVVNLLFGVSKAYRDAYPKGRAAFGMTDTTYKRIRSIATGVTGDTRLVFGDDVESYMLFGHPVGIEENGLSNSDIFFAQLGGYRMYRRQGLRFRREMGGETLVKENAMLISADMRYGGQLDRPGYAAVIDSAPA